MGRTRQISAGFTYGFMDMIDYFIEECRGATYRRDDGWKPFRQRRETIRCKNRNPVEVFIYENEHGILECDPRAAAAGRRTAPLQGVFGAARRRGPVVGRTGRAFRRENGRRGAAGSAQRVDLVQLGDRRS